MKLRYPNITGKTPEERQNQLERFLRGMVDQLNMSMQKGGTSETAAKETAQGNDLIGILFMKVSSLLKQVEYLVKRIRKTPVNLLDNSDFRNPVNQRGQTSYTGLGCYTIDRWLKEQKSTVSITSDGITIDNSNSDTYDCFIQKIDSELVNKLIGKTITIAMCKTDGTIYCNSGVVVYDAPVAQVNTDSCTLMLHLFSDAASWQGARLTLENGQKVTLKWIALYEGEYTIDTLPEYQPKGYATELMECRRYFYRTTNAHVVPVTNYDWLCGGVQFPITMRTTPSLSNLRIADIANPGVNIATTETIVYRTQDGIGAINHPGAFVNMTYCFFEADISADL